MKVPVNIQRKQGQVWVDVPSLDIVDYVGATKKEAMEAAIAASILEIGIRVADGRIHVQDAYVIEFEVWDAPLPIELN